MTNGVLRCEVLGVPGVRLGAADVALGTPIARHLWSELVAARGRRVSDTELIDVLWDDPPASARTSLRTYVTRLRDRLDPERRGLLVHEHGGYRLPVELVETDALEFERACEQVLGRSATFGAPAAVDDRAAIDHATSLWRGEPYESVPDTGHVGAERRRLRGMRDLLTRAHLETMVGEGRADEALAPLASYVEQHPTDEHAAALRALALYRVGRQVDALEELLAARTSLLEEWGLDPSVLLARVEQQVLAQDPSLMLQPGRDTGRGTASERETAVVGAALPAPLTSFVGRHHDVDRLQTMVGEHRLVSVVAIGGTGKTRLALEAATRMAAADPEGSTQDGPWFVDLGGLHEIPLIAETIAVALGMLPGSGLADLRQALAGRRTLLVLDNCEHLVDGLGRVVAELLSACAGVRVLATSRIPLGVAGEVVLDLAPLEVHQEAVALFRARATSAGYPTEDDDTSVRAICVSLDGHPLAIELAAAQCRLLTVDQVAGQLAERFDLLVEPRAGRGAATRGASLRSVLGWSVERLSEADRACFETLSVFDGGFDIAAAQTVCADHHDLISSLLALRDAGLVQALDTRSGRRYRMLETLRLFAEQTAPPERLQRARQDHLTWVCDLARAAGPALRTSHAHAWSDRLDAEMGNVRRALRVALDTRRTLEARLIVGELAWFWFRRGYVTEGLQWAGEATAGTPEGMAGTATDAGSEEQDEAVKQLERATGRAWMGLGLMSYLSGAIDQLGEQATQAIASARSAGDAQTDAFASAYLSYLLVFLGDVDRAQQLADEALVVADGAPDWTRADVLMLRGQMLRALGRPEEAVAALEESVRVAGQTGHSWCQGSATWILGKIAFDQGDHPAAAARAGDAAHVQRAAGDVTSWLVCLVLLAASVAASGRRPEAVRLFGAVRAQAERIAFDPVALDFLDAPAHLAALHGDLDAAQLDLLLGQGALLDGDRLDVLARELTASTTS